MNAATQALYDRLMGDTAVTDKLSRYHNASSIFAGDDVPRDAPLNWVYILPPISDVEHDTKGFQGRELLYDIWVCAKREDGSKAHDDLVEAVRARLHRAEITVTGYALVNCLVTDNIAHDPSDEMLARTVSVTITIMQEGILT